VDQCWRVCGTIAWGCNNDLIRGYFGSTFDQLISKYILKQTGRRRSYKIVTETFCTGAAAGAVLGASVNVTKGCVVEPIFFVQLQLARSVLENWVCTAGIPFKYFIIGAGADIAVGFSKFRLTVTGAITPVAESAGRSRGWTFGEQN
jgi:hypothetical protein